MKTFPLQCGDWVNMSRKDWFSYLNDSEMGVLADEYLAGPKNLDQIGNEVWGYKGIGVVCAGCDEKNMKKISQKLFDNKFLTISKDKFSIIIEGSNVNNGFEPLPSILTRLKEKGFIV